MDEETHRDVEIRSGMAMDNYGSAPYAGALFPGSQHFVVSGGTFNSNISNITQNITQVFLPADFRSIPLGDINLRSDANSLNGNSKPSTVFQGLANFVRDPNCERGALQTHLSCPTTSELLLHQWIHRRGSPPIESTYTPPVESDSPAANDPSAGPRFTNISQSILDHITLASALVEQVAKRGQAAPLIVLAAALLSDMKVYTEGTLPSNRKWRELIVHIADLTGDLCATVLRMAETNHSDLIGCLEQDLKKYAGIMEKVAQIIKTYIADLTGDLWATVLWMAEGNHSDLIGRLEQDLKKYAGIMEKVARIIKLGHEYAY
ncbi:hypothetical protein DFH07DRAFT_772093 [Mycena maculata]|uniref:Uncharacterized protein n=1 Tax=Mycena maculata TaxID=230809 RepID=A0AAD7JAJ6_9AGAR|nr:hypothetical protein DFH07DRAFT_772093 [Mycena maculata]